MVFKACCGGGCGTFNSMQWIPYLIMLDESSDSFTTFNSMQWILVIILVLTRPSSSTPPFNSMQWILTKDGRTSESILLVFQRQAMDSETHLDVIVAIDEEWTFNSMQWIPVGCGTG